MSLIDREKLLEAYDREHKGPAGRARQLIVEAPSVSTVVIGQCKECKFFAENSKYCFCEQYQRFANPLGFCNDWERK